MSDGINDCSGDEYRYKSEKKVEMSDKRSRDLSDPSYVEPCNHEVGRTITCRLGTYGCSIHDAESSAPPVREPARQVSCTECDGDGCAKCRPDEICAECLDYFANHPKYGSVSTCDHRGPTPVSEVERLREALRKVIEVPLKWNNNLMKEWEASRQIVRVYGDPEIQHTDKTYEVGDEAKGYAVDILANVWAVMQSVAADAMRES